MSFLDPLTTDDGVYPVEVLNDSFLSLAPNNQLRFM